MYVREREREREGRRGKRQVTCPNQLAGWDGRMGAGERRKDSKVD